MDGDFVKERIATLRTQRGISARDMSLSLGQSNSYINHIENGRYLPSLQGLFYICEYLGVTPKEFFDDEVTYPVELGEIMEELKKLDADSLDHVKAILREMNTK